MENGLIVASAAELRRVIADDVAVVPGAESRAAAISRRAVADDCAVVPRAARRADPGVDGIVGGDAAFNVVDAQCVVESVVAYAFAAQGAEEGA